MKIYHKRSFAGGILCLLLAVGCGALLAAEGFQVKLLVSLALLAAAVTLFCVILAAFVILLCTNAYYERHL